MVTWTSFLLPVSRNGPEIEMSVPPALGPLAGVTVWGIGFWWGSHKTQHQYILIFPLQRFTNTRSQIHTCKHAAQCYGVHKHTHGSSHPPWSPSLSEPFTHISIHTLIQPPPLPQFAEQTVRRSTPLWGSFSGAGDMKSQLNSYAVACSIGEKRGDYCTASA